MRTARPHAGPVAIGPARHGHRPGFTDAARLRRYLRRDCMALALAVHQLTGWPLVWELPRTHDDAIPDDVPYHVYAAPPCGHLLDAAGATAGTGLHLVGGDPAAMAAVPGGRHAGAPEVMVNAAELVELAEPCERPTVAAAMRKVANGWLRERMLVVRRWSRSNRQRPAPEPAFVIGREAATEVTD